MGTFFDGRYLETPTAATAVNDDGMRNQNIGIGNIVALVGRSASGKPKSVLRFGTPEQARAELVSGELLDAVLAAFDPSNQTGGPSEVVAIRVQPAIPATGVMKDANGNAAINLASRGNGQRENLVGWKVEPGSLSGLRVTTQRGTETFTQDNLGRKALTVRYTGPAATATIDVTGTQAVLSAPAGAPVSTLLFAEVGTVQDLVDRINLVPGFSATLEGDSYTAPTAHGLDYVAALDVKTAPGLITADLQAVIDWLNSARQGFTVATRAAGADTRPAVSSMQFLSGGSDGTTTMTDWSDAFATLETIDVQWVVPVSGDAALRAMADAHVQFMSTVGMKERRCVTGMPLNTTRDEAKAAAKALNSDRTSLLFQGHYDYVDGKLKLLPAYISAARVAGAFSGVNPGTPLTNKNFKCRGLEIDLRNPTDTNDLIPAGVLCLENTDDGYKIVKSISTWLVNDNFNRVEQSVGVATDFVARFVRTEQKRGLVGQKASPLTLARAKSITQSALGQLALPEEQGGPGVLVGDENDPPFKNITCSLVGDVIRTQFECHPALGVNFALNTIFVTPYSGTI